MRRPPSYRPRVALPALAYDKLSHETPICRVREGGYPVRILENWRAAAGRTVIFWTTVSLVAGAIAHPVLAQTETRDTGSPAAQSAALESGFTPAAQTVTPESGFTTSQAAPQIRLDVKPVAADYLPVENGRLYFEVFGEGFPIVFIHDGLAHREVWDDQVLDLYPDYRVIRYDRRGYGKSDVPTAPYSNVADLHSIVEHLTDRPRGLRRFFRRRRARDQLRARPPRTRGSAGARGRGGRRARRFVSYDAPRVRKLLAGSGGERQQLDQRYLRRRAGKRRRPRAFRGAPPRESPEPGPRKDSTGARPRQARAPEPRQDPRPHPDRHRRARPPRCPRPRGRHRSGDHRLAADRPRRRRAPRLSRAAGRLQRRDPRVL